MLPIVFSNLLTLSKQLEANFFTKRAKKWCHL